MKVNMDEEMVAYQLRKAEESRPSGVKWLLIIALGVFLGNAASFGLERAVLYWELKQVALAATASMELISRNMTETRKIRDQQSAQQRKMMEEQRNIKAAQEKQRQIQRQNQQQQKQAGYRQAKETCDFWVKQLTTENTAFNRMNRDQACNLVNQFR
jgi:uncharacterized protein YaiL (DUF2058 family)